MVVRSSIVSIIILAAVDADKYKSNISINNNLIESLFGFTLFRVKILLLYKFVTSLRIASFNIASNLIGDTLYSILLPEERIVIIESIGSIGLSKLIKL